MQRGDAMGKKKAATEVSRKTRKRNPVPEVAAPGYQAASVDQKLTRLCGELSEIRRFLERLVAFTENQAARDGPAVEQEVVVLREVPRDEAKAEIRQAIDADPGIGFGDLAVRLRLDLDLVVELCQELLGEGKIEEVK